jgi:hypothetical protein
MIQFTPHNEPARQKVKDITSRLDGRRNFNQDDVGLVVSYAYAHCHKPYFTVIGYPTIADELVDKGIFRRHSGKRNYTLAPELLDSECQWGTVKTDDSLKHHLLTKSQTYFTNRQDCLELSFDEVKLINFMPAQLIQSVDMEASLCAFRDEYKPSFSFLSCDYPVKDAELVAKWEEHLDRAIERDFLALVKIKDGYVTPSPSGAHRALGIELSRFFNKAGMNFAVNVTSQYGGRESCYGQY